MPRWTMPWPFLGLLAAASSPAFASESEFYASDNCAAGLVYVLKDGVVQTTLSGTYNSTTSCDRDQFAYTRDYDGDGYTEDLYCCFDGADTYPSSTYTRVAEIDGFVDADTDVRGDCDDDDPNTYPDAVEVCDGVLNDCPLDGSSTEAPTDETDDDGDGYVECTAWAGDDTTIVGGDDCDDTDATVYPGATEICDGQLNDCDSSDGIPDDEIDDDGDGYVDCDSWKGNDTDIIDGDDCDDTDATIYPGADELCDGLINNCNTTALPDDESDADSDGYVSCDPWVGGSSLAGGDCDDTDPNTAPGAAEFEPDLCATDADGDGYGDSSATGLIDAGTDCDDTDAAVHPDQAEVCEDGDQVDTDCDGNVNTSGCGADDGDEDCEVVADGIVTAYIDADGDGYAATDATESISVCARVDGYSESRTDCDDTDAAINIDATEACEDGVDNNCDGQVDEANASGCKTMYRDLDGDGYGDYDVSACLCADDAGDGSLDGDTYVVQGGDCYDGDRETHPVSCDDGLDNDGDGLIDGDDPDCQAVPELNEGGTAREDSYEYLDGHDNNCDGYIPAVELDCDDDGALPLVPTLSKVVETSADIGLASCGDPDATKTITCWDQDITLDCDLDANGNGSGLWVLAYTESSDAEGGRYSNGQRIYTAGDIPIVDGDCDDLCALRSPSLTESCDGLDNDCAGAVGADQDGDGIPDAMQSDEVPVAGLVSAKEIDLDQDGALPCEDFTGTEDQVYESEATCSDVVTDAASLTDCSNRCSAAYSGATERCDGFTDNCDGDAEGTDADGDGYATCGAWGVDGDTSGEEDIYLVVWIRQDTSATDSATDTATDTSGPTDVLADMVPLMLPRPDAPECDRQLADQLGLLEGPEVFDQIQAGGDPTLLLQGCSNFGGTCALLKLTITPGIDADTADTWLPEAESLGFADPNCVAHPEQMATRTVWSRDQILEARGLVVEWECERQFGKSCAEAAASPALVDGWDIMADASGALTSAAWWWWMQIDRFSPSAVTAGTLGECWGDGATYDSSTQTVGGDCADSASGANRDAPEGPWDLSGIYLGEQVSCDQCTDGIDNNCDGLTDCEDPSCAPCFVGEGFGCGGDDTNSCSATGCTVVTERDSLASGLTILATLALSAGLRRRQRM